EVELGVIELHVGPAHIRGRVGHRGLRGELPERGMVLHGIRQATEARVVGAVAVLENEALLRSGQGAGAFHHLGGGGAQPIEPRLVDGSLDHHVAVVGVVMALLGGEHPGRVREDVFRRHGLSPFSSAVPGALSRSTTRRSCQRRRGQSNLTPSALARHYRGRCRGLSIIGVADRGIQLPPSGPLALVTVVLAWGFTWPVNKVVLATLSPLWAVTLRSAIATVALFALQAMSGRVMPPPRGDLPVLVSITLLHMVGFNLLASWGSASCPPAARWCLPTPRPSG